MERVLTVSKVERDKFHFTGLDVCGEAGKISVSMNDYVQSLKEVENIRKADRDSELSRLEMKEFRKMTGKLAWLANSTRPDLNFTALQLSKKNTSAIILDLRGINKVLKKVKERYSEIN